MDEGEAEAIALAKELHADLLLIDEKLGKQFAEAENIACKGVVGILIEAKVKGLIQLVKPLLDNLVNNLKFRLSLIIFINSPCKKQEKHLEFFCSEKFQTLKGVTQQAMPRRTNVRNIKNSKRKT